jgi:hypothetical protein
MKKGLCRCCAVTLGGLALFIVLAHLDFSLAAQGKRTVKDSFKAHTTANPAGGITNPVKLCSGIGGTSRDTIVVPDSWKAGTCQSYAESIRGSSYQLGCANADNFSWGDLGGGTPPSNNCNW